MNSTCRTESQDQPAPAPRALAPLCGVIRIPAACSPPWSWGFTYRVWRGAKVWGTGVLPLCCCHSARLWRWKTFYGPGPMLCAPSPGSTAASPQREAMPGLGVVEVSWVRGAGRAMADVSGCQRRAAPGWGSPPAWLLPPAQHTRHRDFMRRQPGVGTGTIHGMKGCAVCVQAQSSSS